MDLFVYFWPEAKTQKYLIHIYQVRDRQRDDQTNKKQTFYRTPHHKQVQETKQTMIVSEEIVLTQTLTRPPIFWENP